MDPQPRGPVVVEKPDLPEIKLKPNIKEMVELAIEALADDAAILQRGGALVHIVNHQDRPDPIDGAIALRPCTTPTIKQLK